MKNLKLKKYVASPTLAFAVIFFVLAGISFFAPKQKNAPSQPNKKIQITTPTNVLGNATTVAPTEIVVTQIIYPTTNPLPTQTTTTSTTTSTQTSNPQVSMTVSEPDGTNTFTIDYHDGMTACDSLTEAKNEGKIKSLTMQWYASLNSNYVKDINGYSNNWTFTANGQSPMGCSLYSVQKGDSIVWKYN